MNKTSVKDRQMRATFNSFKPQTINFNEEFRNFGDMSPSIIEEARKERLKANAYVQKYLSPNLKEEYNRTNMTQRNAYNVSATQRVGIDSDYGESPLAQLRKLSPTLNPAYPPSSLILPGIQQREFHNDTKATIKLKHLF